MNDTDTTVIGLEVHVQLATAHKLFSPAERRHAPEQPNTFIDPFSTGLPGALPVLNLEAVEHAVRVAIALSCTVHPTSEWDRKHYFYPDLPKGFQITQQRCPLATRGHLDILDDEGRPRRIGIGRVHIEEDAGKSIHSPAGLTQVDFNRAGAPLIEIVSDPDLRSPQEARRFLKRIRAIVRSIGASTAHMERGELRCDANVSIRGSARTELKNLNSFRHVEQALAFELNRHQTALREGTELTAETRLWDPARRTTKATRTKASAADYRFLPEPDLAPLTLHARWLAAVQENLPELPAARSARYRTLGLFATIADALADERELNTLFDAAVEREPASAPAVAALLLGEVARLRNANDKGDESTPLPIGVDALLRLVQLRSGGRISATQQKALVARVWAEGDGALDAADTPELLSQGPQLAPFIEEVLDRHPDVVAKYKAGKRGVLGFLMGAVMKATRGRANPPVVRQMLVEHLEKEP